MALAVPQMALGLNIQNANFARAGTTAGEALGWTDVVAGITHAAVYDDSPLMGHARVQKYTLGAGVDDAKVGSSRATPGFLTLAGSQELSGWLWYKTDANVDATHYIELIVLWYDEDGALLSSDDAQTINSAQTTWTGATATTTLTCPADAHHARVGIRMVRSGDSTSFSIWLAFAGVGVWKSTDPAGAYEEKSKYTWERLPTLGNSFSVPTVSDREIGRNAHGERLHLVNDRFADSYLTQLGVAVCGYEMHSALHYAWQMNKGRIFDAAGLVAGGCWPIILYTGSTDVYGFANKIGLYDFDGTEFPLRPATQIEWAPHPPYFSGATRFLERI
jgi:hypothetical protein